jgi:hypothetical protein
MMGWVRIIDNNCYRLSFRSRFLRERFLDISKLDVIS